MTIIALTDASIRALKPSPDGKQVEYYDKLTPALCIRVGVGASGRKSWVLRSRVNGGALRRIVLGAYPQLTLAEARRVARDYKAGIVTAAPERQAEAFRAVAQRFIEWQRDEKRLISWRAQARALGLAPDPQGGWRVIVNGFVDRWGRRDIRDIDRHEITAALDEKAKVAATSANRNQAHLHRLFAWAIHRVKGLDANPVIREKAGERSRKRTLDDGEIRLIWTTAECAGAYGAIVCLALITAQRKAKVASMRRSDLDGDLWTIPGQEREKGTAGALRLPDTALAIIKAQPRLKGTDYIFPGRKEGEFFLPGNKPHKMFCNALPMAEWRFHDLRRTARVLMSRAKVDRDIAERVLGHRVGDAAEATYDRFEYLDEKSDAVQRIADMISRIVTGLGPL